MTGEGDPQSGFIEVNGAQIYYHASGAGRPLILVHAGICDSRMWEDQVPVFNKGYQVIRYDMRGYGRSSMPEGDFSHSSDLEGLLSALEIEKAEFIGCSMGGRVVIELALDHPESVSAMVLAAAAVSGYDFEAEPPPQWDEMVSAFNGGDFARAAELECQIWVDGPLRTPEDLDPGLRRRVIEMDVIALANEARQEGQEIRRPPAAPRLGEIQVPTLIIAGEQDQPDLVQVARAMHAGLAGSQLVVMEGVAHLPNMEKPDEFNRLVMDFLTRISR
jgi:pimeloyl-ACP methyl ester carboxylesterase